MASTYRDWSQMGRAYQLKAGPAAQVTPELQALADQVTAGISDRREQADALYRWVAQNIRYRAEHPRQPLWRLQGPRDDPGGAAGGKGHRQFASADRSGRWPDPAEDSGTGPLPPRHHLHSRV
ncbi:hypothetical protein G6F66_014964 [Rhizopus arrhizus]|nr:hypothetical protein G6F66_014964 [Rhizopus arrhizus]